MMRHGLTTMLRHLSPCNFVSYWKYITFCMKVLPHTNIAQSNDRHDAHIEWKHRLPLPISGDNGYVMIATCYDMRLQTFWFLPLGFTAASAGSRWFLCSWRWRKTRATLKHTLRWQVINIRIGISRRMRRHRCSRTIIQCIGIVACTRCSLEERCAKSEIRIISKTRRRDLIWFWKSRWGYCGGRFILMSSRVIRAFIGDNRSGRVG